MNELSEQLKQQIELQIAFYKDSIETLERLSADVDKAQSKKELFDYATEIYQEVENRKIHSSISRSLFLIVKREAKSNSK